MHGPVMVGTLGFHGNHAGTNPYVVFAGVEEGKLLEELVNSSWCGMLAALALLLDAR